MFEQVSLQEEESEYQDLLGEQHLSSFVLDANERELENDVTD